MGSGPASRYWRRFWEPAGNPLIFVVIAWLFAISTNLWSDIPWVQEHEAFFLAVPPLLALVAILVLWPAREVTPQTTLISPGRKYKGVVVLASIGPGIETARAAIEHHMPVCRRVWIVHSDTSHTGAKEIRHGLIENHRFDESDAPFIAVTDAAFADPEAVRTEIENLVYGALPEGFEESDVVIDITGGKKETTAGAFLAGLPPHRHLQVTAAAATDPETGRGLRPGRVIEIDVAYRLRKAPRRHSG